MKRLVLENLKGMVRAYSTRGMKPEVGSEVLLSSRETEELHSSQGTVYDLFKAFITSDKESDLFKEIDKILDVYSHGNLSGFRNKGTVLGIEDSVEAIVKSVESIYEVIKSLNKKGFVNDSDLKKMDLQVVRKVVENIQGEDKEGKIIEYESLDNRERLEFSKWWYNIIMLDLYSIIQIIKSSPCVLENLKEDKLLDLEEYAKELKSGLDPSIKLALKRNGMTILKNTYSGFDSEFQYKEGVTNDLLSVQLAVSSRIILKMTEPKEYFEHQSVNTLSSQVYNLSKSLSYLNQGYIFGTIDLRIKFLRELLFTGYDRAMIKLIKGLKEKGIPSTKKGEFIYFLFDKSLLRTWFSTDVQEGVCLSTLVKKSNELTEPDLKKGLEDLYTLLKTIYEKIDIEREEEEEIEAKSKGKSILTEEFQENTLFPEEDKFDFNQDFVKLEKPEEDGGVEEVEEPKKEIYFKGSKYSRTYKQTFTKERVSVTIIKNNYFISHFSVSDLSMLKDFEIFKQELDIVNKAMVTLKKPLLIDGVNVIVRDTLLLAPGTNKKLASLGTLYNLPKIDIGNRIKNMRYFLREDPVLFKEYALQDSRIALIHALFMEEFAFSKGMVGVPLSLSMLASVYLRKNWMDWGYKGYQINPLYYIKSPDTQTPKGLFAVGDIGLSIGYFIASFKGGRNESFMYGVNKEMNWIDYDLISAYTTGMSLMGDPDYASACFISVEELEGKDNLSLINSYLMIKTHFEFPSSVKYPSIPCFADEDATIYPLKGDAILTGAEYLLAREQNCKFIIDKIYYIPFKYMKNTEPPKPIKPFYSVIKDIQSKRSLYPKGTINNLINKELGNCIFGLVAKGISNKRKYDTRLKQTVRLEGNDLSNPILASWITGFIRSVIGELLHCVDLLKGKVISVTTDGFLTNIENLEDKIVKMPKCNFLTQLYKKARVDLSGNDTALEIKSKGKGIISWTTRGQFSSDGVVATTGFQRALYNNKEIEKLLLDGFCTENKEIVYLAHRLRSALDIFKYGGQVVSEYSDKRFRLLYDNRRKIIYKDKKDKELDLLNNLLDSKPVNDVHEALLYRALGKKPITKKYQKRLSEKSFRNKYKNVLEVTVRNFIRCLFTNDMNLKLDAFENYADIAKFVNEYDPSLKITVNIIAQLKRRVTKPKTLVKDAVAGSFIEYVLLKFPDFDSKKFFNEYHE